MICSIQTNLALSNYERDVFSKCKSLTFECKEDTSCLFNTLLKFKKIGLIHSNEKFSQFDNFSVQLTEIGEKFYRNIFQ
jgi:hypothetical protein